MKSTFAGLVVAIIIGAIGLIALRSLGTIKLPSRTASPSPSSTATNPNFELAPVGSAFPSASPVISTPSGSPSTTKGGVTLGETYPTAKPSAKPATVTTTTTTTTVTHVNITLAKSSDCPSSITAEVKDIKQSLSVQYRIKDNYSAAITVWNEKGEEIAGQKTYTGNGKIVDTGSAKNIKVVIQPNKCSDTDENWLEVIATR